MINEANEKIRNAVESKYAEIVTIFESGASSDCCSSDDCCSDDSAEFNEWGSKLYQADLSELPESVAGLSLGCGDPITLAGLTAGQTVLDLGSGGGIDCFLAAERVGETGHVIGVDMTDEMLKKANDNKAKMGKTNVEFRKGHIEELPVADGAIDVIISNCVVNLSPDKAAVFREAYRVLKPGGRIAFSDMVTIGRFSAEKRNEMSQWAGCITGAEDVAVYVSAIKAAGFTNISVRDRNKPDVELADSKPHYGEPKLFSGRVSAEKA